MKQATEDKQKNRDSERNFDNVASQMS